MKVSDGKREAVEEAVKAFIEVFGEAMRKSNISDADFKSLLDAPAAAIKTAVDA